MSRFAGKKGKRGPGAEFTWDTDPGGEPDTAPTPLYPAYVVPYARKISTKEQIAVDKYRQLREAHHEGPYYSVIDASASSAKKGSAARANFDPFTGMPSYSGRYQKKHRTIPKISGVGRDYETRFFPRELWQIIQPNFRPDASLDGYQAQTNAVSNKRGFEDEEDEEDAAAKRRATGGNEDEGDDDQNEGGLLDGDEDALESIADDDFQDDDDEMGGDYDAEQYFDDGGDDYGDDGDGGGGDEEAY
ncbi:uncharacterized protein N7498_010715 [Penicillium cinerascens]|uniref:DNA-directed RNA polymerase III subunit n=1 Tax=Penicillium cinerascens TaxID=70096 RepID=A0A9W9JB85_9EURO|nr:uncharacterized protein N7498_010715 [Penicillium cinerascens]KAJ5191730.1 hypothetical protein N7498_010715 [Penicillium cinerascens]